MQGGDDMDKEKFVKWLERRIADLKTPPKHVVNTPDKVAFIYGAIKTLEAIKQMVEKGKFDINRGDMGG